MRQGEQGTPEPKSGLEQNGPAQRCRGRGPPPVGATGLHDARRRPAPPEPSPRVTSPTQSSPAPRTARGGSPESRAPSSRRQSPP
eukprot:5564260-Pyramimonas_sp.AAC.1